MTSDYKILGRNGYCKRILKGYKNETQTLAQWVKLVKMVKQAELVQLLTMVNYKLVEMAQTAKTHKLAYWSNELKWFVFNN